MTSAGDVSICFTTDAKEEWECWHIKNLWRSAANLPSVMTPLTDFAQHFERTNEDWFSLKTPTLRELSMQAKRIYEADLTFPIILSAEGDLMDGKHRLAKALILGQEEIAVVRFVKNLEPDVRHPK